MAGFWRSFMMSDVPITADTVARALRAAADVIRPEPADPLLAPSVADSLLRLASQQRDTAIAQRDGAKAIVEKLTEDLSAAEQRAAEAEGELAGVRAANETLRREMASARADHRGRFGADATEEYAVDTPSLRWPWVTDLEMTRQRAAHLNGRVMVRWVSEATPLDGQETPSGPLSATESAQNAPEALTDAPGPQNRPEAVLAVVTAARAWARSDNFDRGRYERNQGLRVAVEALEAGNPSEGGIIAAVLTAARDAGWAAGVRWAAAEADAQASGHYNLSGDMIDITDHLRLCADDLRRDTLVPRDQPPEARS
jgi:hypothetical protein